MRLSCKFKKMATSVLAAFLTLFVFSVDPATAAGTDWRVATTFYAKNGDDVPLRYGNSKFGLVHIDEKHPLGRSVLFGYIDDALEDGKYTKQSDGTWKITNQDAAGVRFRVAYSPREDGNSGDGRPVGIITAFRE